MNFRSLAAGALVALGLATSASAVTVSGVIQEGGPEGYYYPGAVNHTFRDFRDSPADMVLTAGGPLTIYGSVTHRGRNTHRDGFTMDFGLGRYAGTFSWDDRLGAFDGQLIVGSLAIPISGSGSLALSGLTGLVAFQVDPVFGAIRQHEVIRWTLDLAPVPVPAGAVLLLSALGGFAALRRRRTAAA